MDPDVTLGMIRRLVEKVAVMADKDAPASNIAEAGIDLAEYVGAMDEWLSKGGFLPKEWDHS